MEGAFCRGGGGLMIGYILLFTGRGAYQWGLIGRSLQYGVFFGRANVFARESAMLKLQKRGRNGASQEQRGRGGGESSVCQRTEFPKRTVISGRRIFLLSPSPILNFRPSTYPKGCYFYSPQYSSGIKSKMVATTIRT